MPDQLIPHLDELPQYFAHSLGCYIHFLIPFVVVSLIVGVLYVVKWRDHPPPAKKLTPLLLSLFFLLWIVDIPAALGRCPGSEIDSNLGFESYDPSGLFFGLFAGLITFLSPCGLPPLPAYISHFLGARASKERGLGVAFIASFAFALAILVMGAVIYTLRSIILKGSFLFVIIVDPVYLEMIEFFAGFLAIGMGVLMLLSIRVPFFKFTSRFSSQRGVKGIFAFGLGWGTAAITCAPYAFIPTVLYAIGRGGLEPFLGFALGMALPVVAVSVILGAGQRSSVERLIRVNPKLHRISSMILIAMGIYIVQYTFFTVGPYLVWG